MDFYRRQRLVPKESPNIDVPKLDENQLQVLSALFVINATQGFVEAQRWLTDFEIENELPLGSLDGFLDFFPTDFYLN